MTNDSQMNGTVVPVAGQTVIPAYIVENTATQLTPEQDAIIKKLVYYQQEYESPSQDDVKKIAVSLSVSFFVCFI